MGFAKAQPILRAGGKAAKQRPVLPPRLGRLLVEPVTDEGEKLGGFKDHVIDEVHHRDDRKQDRHAARDLKCPRCLRELLPRSTRSLPPAAKASEEAVAFSWHGAWKEKYGQRVGRINGEPRQSSMRKEYAGSKRAVARVPDSYYFQSYSQLSQISTGYLYETPRETALKILNKKT
jgi:hypothetical protein